MSIPSSSDEVATRHGIWPSLSSSSISTPLLAGDRAVVRARDLFLGELVQPQRQPLGEPAVVDEDDRRAVLLDEAQQLRVDRRPDRGRVALAAGAEQRIGVRACARLAHVLDRDDDPQVELLARAGVDDPDRPRSRDEAADLLDRALRRREADALHRLAGQPVEALDRQREVRAALGAGDRVHLVEDQRLDRRAASPAPCEVSSRKSDSGVVIRMSGGLRSIAARSFAGVSPGAHRDGQLRLQPGERPAQVPLDVVVQRLQRRDVQQPQPLARARR